MDQYALKSELAETIQCTYVFHIDSELGLQSLLMWKQNHSSP